MANMPMGGFTNPVQPAPTELLKCLHQRWKDAEQRMAGELVDAAVEHFVAHAQALLDGMQPIAFGPVPECPSVWGIRFADDSFLALQSMRPDGPGGDTGYHITSPPKERRKVGGSETDEMPAVGIMKQDDGK